MRSIALEGPVINLAIIVAVSEYIRDVKPLPACKNDGVMMRTILEGSSRFEEILDIDTKDSSQTVKRKIAEFIKKHQNQEINEIVFYFSGHGEARQDDVFYFLADYEKSKTNQTAISNAEMDDSIRSLNPALFTKIVDACHSGVNYVKSNDEVSDTLKRNAGRFSKIYFMFSSHQNQESFAEEKLSDFTASFGKAIRRAENGQLRHRDIISSIADDFSTNSSQTPFFVSQSDNTDVFIYVNDALKEKLSDFYEDEEEAADDDDSLALEKGSLALTLAERIKTDAMRYCSRDEALSIVAKLKTLIDECYVPSEYLRGLYSVQISAVNAEVPGGAEIGLWIQKNDRSLEYFARPVMKQETYQKRVPKNPSLSVLANLSLVNQPEYTLVSDVRTVVETFHQTNDMDYEYLQIRLNPFYPNIGPEECLIVPIFTRTQLRFFWSYSHFRPVDWERWDRIRAISWNTEICELKDTARIQSLIQGIVAGFHLFVEEALRTRWEPPTSDGNSPTSG